MAVYGEINCVEYNCIVTWKYKIEKKTEKSFFEIVCVPLFNI